MRDLSTLKHQQLPRFRVLWVIHDSEYEAYKPETSKPGRQAVTPRLDDVLLLGTLEDKGGRLAAGLENYHDTIGLI